MSQEAKKNNILKMSEGLGVALIVSLGAVLILSLIVKSVGLSNSAIKLINQFIKVIAIFFGCFVGVRESKGFFKGAFLGAIIIIFTYLLFSIISWSFSFSYMTLIDLAFGGLIGGISGAVVVNIKK